MKNRVAASLAGFFALGFCTLITVTGDLQAQGLIVSGYGDIEWTLEDRGPDDGWRQAFDNHHLVLILLGSIMEDLIVGAEVEYEHVGDEVALEYAQLASLERIDLESQRVLDTVVNTGEVYRRQCVACHGETGEGNGPAAVAFNPKPANLTDPEVMSERTDEELLNVLRKGKGAMPAFSALLSDEDLVRMVRYIRTLSAKP